MAYPKSDLKTRITSDSPFAEVIEDAYRVFKRRTPMSTYTCACCMYPEIQRDFFKHGQRDLPFHYLADWYQAAAEPDLPNDFWAWILPRILEVLASGAFPAAYSTEVTFNRYPTGERTRWSAKEWSVLDRFQRLYFDLWQPGRDDFLDDIICMFALGKWPVEDLFAQIMAWPTERLIDQLSHDWRAFKPGGSIWTTNFWADRAVPMAFWTSGTLHDRFLNYGADAQMPADRRDRALRLAEAILCAR